jgi:hypothetical protein
MKKKKELNFEDWILKNEDDLYIEAAETGADREYDYDSEKFYEEQYTIYLESL